MNWSERYFYALQYSLLCSSNSKNAKLLKTALLLFFERPRSFSCAYRSRYYDSDQALLIPTTLTYSTRASHFGMREKKPSTRNLLGLPPNLAAAHLMRQRVFLAFEWGIFSSGVWWIISFSRTSRGATKKPSVFGYFSLGVWGWLWPSGKKDSRAGSVYGSYNQSYIVR